MSYKPKHYGITGAPGSGPRLDVKPDTGPQIEVMALARNEIMIGQNLSFEVHLKYFLRMSDAHKRFADFMKEKYNYPPDIVRMPYKTELVDAVAIIPDNFK